MTPVLGDRSLFPSLEARAYLNHAAISPPSAPVTDAIAAALQCYASQGVAAFATYLEQREELRQELGALVGAQPEEIGFVANTTAGVVFAAMCFPWERGDGVVVLDGEFPTNVTPWQQAAELYGLQVHRLAASHFGSPDPGQGLAQLDAALRSGAKLVAVSAVQFQTGLRMPLRAIVHMAHRHGAAVFVDAIQAVGVVPMDFAELGVDLATCGGHKWLMGVEGTGFVYVSNAWAPRLRPRLAGWLSHQDGLGFLFDGPGHLRYDRPIKSDASMVESGAYNTLGFAGLGASVGLLRALGTTAIYEHVQSIHNALETPLSELGLTSERSPSPGERSGILSFTLPEHVDPTRVVPALSEAGIAVTLPDGRLRLAPHWPNNEAEVPLIVEATRAALLQAQR